MDIDKIIHGHCVEKLLEIESNKVDLIYFDPPFLHNANIYSLIKTIQKLMNLMINMTQLRIIYYLLKTFWCSLKEF
jgi:DNA modification methylase